MILQLTSGKPRLLDLFCGAGGASMGYHRAGFEVTGVDIVPQKRYPFRFIQDNALEYLYKHGWKYDFIHASPPCQTHSQLNKIHKIKASTSANHVDLIPQTRALLELIGKPYVIENVVGAPLINAACLCGSMFGLKVYRHRLFESPILILTPPHVPHRDNTPTAGKGISDKGFVSITSGGIKNMPDGWTPAAYKNMAMGIDWMTQEGLAQAIPPAYTEWIGRQLMGMLFGAAKAA
jgi:DNA (cytosine-5)-methyltransferase 1